MLTAKERKRLQRLLPSNFTVDLIQKIKTSMSIINGDQFISDVFQIKRTLSTLSDEDGQKIVRQTRDTKAHGITKAWISNAKRCFEDGGLTPDTIENYDSMIWIHAAINQSIKHESPPLAKIVRMFPDRWLRSYFRQILHYPQFSSQP